jgi:hypothetical protein
MLIVEGPDGAGKSHLVDRLTLDLGLLVQPRACRSDTGVDPLTLRDWVDGDLSRPVHERAVYDRYPLISEPIYGTICRGRVAPGFDDPYWLIRSWTMLLAKEPIFVYCLPPWREVGENIDKDHLPDTEHLFQVIQHGHALYDAYVHQAAFHVLNGLPRVMIWDYTKDEDYAFIRDVVKGVI